MIGVSLPTSEGIKKKKRQVKTVIVVMVIWDHEAKVRLSDSSQLISSNVDT